jgi:hypothetical protein
VQYGIWSDYVVSRHFDEGRYRVINAS